MPQKVSAKRLGQAVLDSVHGGQYPDTEEIISAEFPPSVIPEVLILFDNARSQVEARVRTTSQSSAPDIDGWVSQAKQLRSDIGTAQRFSQDILAEAERNKQLRQHLHDAESKLRLLEGELAFSQRLSATLAQIRSIDHAIRDTAGYLRGDQVSHAIDTLAATETELESIPSARNIKAVGMLDLEIKSLRQEIAYNLNEKWQKSIHIGSLTISIPQDAQDSTSKLANGLEAAIIVPRTQLQNGGHERFLVVDGDSLRITETSSPSNSHQLYDDLRAFIQFLQVHLPTSVAVPLSKVLGPKIVETLISMRLSSAVPEELHALQEFSNTRDEIYQFAATMGSYKWAGDDQLRAWSNSIPQVWLKKRQNSSLHQVRQLLKRGYGAFRTAERVETQRVSQQDCLFTGNSINDDWDAGWSDEEKNIPAEKRLRTQNANEMDNEEDMSAWGLDDEGAEEDKTFDVTIPANNDEEEDAWGWGDDQNVNEDKRTSQREATTPSTRRVNGHTNPHGRTSEREVTLKESYNITSLPTGILELINHVFSDIDTLSEPSRFDGSLATPAISGLLALPSLFLVMYRASAARFYFTNNSGNMFLYNDCLWLADQLRQMLRARNKRRPNAVTSKQKQFQFDDDLAALEAFGKRSYGKEMDSQRTIIKDFLDGAQGFGNCTEPPFSQECDLAINSIIDRLGGIHKEWKRMLSHSALLQSVGSLLSTVVDKIIIDVEDMSDISEPQSQRLTGYCKQITALEDLFLPQEVAASGQEAVPLTAVYTPGWFKFQFLSEILDSSLVDIKYLWMDGGLELEYEAEEVVELIEALFADSEHRRRAIGEIRRASKA
ncbi:MAG: hypothetical protein LQ352_000756 [Teloschistes flavicans]|nr:MAG: hypothetical protein LQ352_000756 [Teloschistes flavicans]